MRRYKLGKVHILCDGGFGNRLGALIPGLIIADELDREPVISWPVTKWCECEFEDIYEPFCEVNTKTTDELFLENINSHFLIHHNLSGREADNPKLNLKNQYPVHNSDLAIIIDNFKNLNSNEDIVFTNHIIPQYFSEDVIIKYLKKLNFKKSILDRIYNFCSDNNFDIDVPNTSGIHIRKTDFPSNFLLDDNQINKMVSENKDTNFFICSDDIDTENKVNEFSNVIIHQKDNSVVTHNNDRFNISRPKDSVIDGVVDMLILSRTQILNTNFQSTFLVFALRYGKLKLEEI